MAGLIVLVVAAVALFFVLRDDDPAPAAGATTTATGSSEAGTSSRPSSSAPSSSTSAPPTTGGAGPGGDLLAILPVDFPDCAEAALAGDGDVAHASCGPSTTQPGPQQAEFFQYPDKATMDSVFTNDASGQGLAQLPEGQDCTATTGIGSWGGGSNSGLVACAIDTGNNAVVITWTDDAALVEGIVGAPGATQADLAALYTWWQANSDYRL
ncbi:hypothetical protein [Geodermatophilus sp. SYSU D00684]